MKLLESQFIRRVLTLVSGVVLAQAIYLLVLPVLTRLYTPDAFSIFSQYLSLMGILSAAFCLRFDDAVFVVAGKRKIRAVLKLGITSAFCMFILSLLVLIALKPWLVSFSDIKLPELIYFLLPLAAMLQALYLLLCNGALKLGEARKVATTQVQRHLSISVFQVGLVFVSSLKEMGLALGDIAGKAIGVFALLGFNQRKTAQFTTPWAYQWRLAKTLKRFPLISAPNALINVGANQITPLILIALYDLRVAGVFYVAQRVTSAPLVLLGKAISQVYSSELADMMSSGVDVLKRSYEKMIQKLFLISVLPVVLLATLSPWLGPLILGSEWIDAGYFIALLAPSLLAQMVVTPLSNVANILNKQGMMLVWDISRLLSILGGFGFVHYFEYSEFYAIGVYSIITAFFFMLQMFLIWNALRVSESRIK